jgi:Tripartite tricarboxylate transporter TctB family
MSRDSLFSIGLFVIVAGAVWGARDWNPKAQLFPWAIGFPLLGLIAVQVLVSLRTAQKVGTVRTVSEADLGPQHARLRSILVWLAAFAGVIWLLGFPIGGTLATLAYLKLTARESWRLALGLAAGTAVFFWITAGPLLNIAYPTGLLIQLLPLPR